MAKTITLRVDDGVYTLFKQAAQGERRTISNFIEYATLGYLVQETRVSEAEMAEILADRPLVRDLKKGLRDCAKGNYRIVG